MASKLDFACIVAVLLAYPLLGRACLRLGSPWRMRLFAALNVASVAALRVLDAHPPLAAFAGLFAGYLLMVVVHHAAVRRFASAPGWRPWAAFALPLAYLVIVKAAPRVGPLASVAGEVTGLSFIGISYMAFRLSRLVLEVRNGEATPDLGTYLAFAFFVPTISVGPISPYGLFRASLDRPDPAATPAGRSLLRIVVGLSKYFFLAHLVNRLSYAGLLLDGHPHRWADLPVAAVAYYLYLYCNFSGFCDLAIGFAGLLGLRVAENFDHPLGARNVKEFWNRWHITLSIWMRDVLFTPASKVGARLLGPRGAPHAIAVAIVVVFLLVGVWHGIGWGFVIFGALHALGVVANHYYALALKELLGKARLRAYLDSGLVRGASIAATQVYVTATFFFFANDPEQMIRIGEILRKGVAP